MTKYLPDTNIFIRALYGHEPEASFLRGKVKKAEISISVIVIAEFYSKAQKDEKKVFDKLLANFEATSVDSEIAKTAGEYRKKFSQKTKKVFLIDCFLAAQAKVHDLTLVTNNKSDFPMTDIKTTSPAKRLL